MEESVGECVVLRRFLGKDPPCLHTCTCEKFPSYYSGRNRKGCWVAHTALCILEAIRIKDDILAVIEKRGIKWKTLLFALLLHDSGKVSKDYTSKGGPRIRHNETSAQIAYEVLGRLLERGYADKDERKVVSRACFLHMEYYEWKSLKKGGFTTISQITTPAVTVELADDVQKPLENLKLVLEEADVLNEAIYSVISGIQEIKKLKLKPSNYTIDQSDQYSWKVQLKTIALQWFILLLDNRASSARRGADAYWDRLLEDARSTYPDVIKFSDQLLITLRGKLTPLPR